VLHGVGILEKGNQMAEPTSYIVEIDEHGNPSIKYADGALTLSIYQNAARNLARYGEDRGTGIRAVLLCA
jgi:hypothetical protein